MTNETWARVTEICDTLMRKRECQDASATYDGKGIRFVVKARKMHFVQWPIGDVTKFAPKTLAGFVWDVVEWEQG